MSIVFARKTDNRVFSVIRQKVAFIVFAGLVGVVFSLGALTGLSITYLKQRLDSVVEAVQAHRDFQGLILDSTATGSLILNVLERQGLFLVKKISIEPLHGGQAFQFESPSNYGGIFSGSSIFESNITTNTHGTFVDLIIEPTLSLSLSILAMSLLVGLLITLALLGFIYWNQQSTELKVAKRVSFLAAQISHDIRSPISALIALAERASNIDAQSRAQLNIVANRIRGIANGLLEINRSQAHYLTLSERTVDSIETSESRSIELLSDLVEEVLREKRETIHSQISLGLELCSNYDYFAEIQTTEFCRIISNLLNNAIEALPLEGGQVTVRLSSDIQSISIEVLDTGKGIASSALAKLGQQWVSIGKESGSGMGLFHAFRTIKLWGGQFSIDSIIGKGTKVKVALPRVPCPSWFAKDLFTSTSRHHVLISQNQELVSHCTDILRSGSTVTLSNFQEVVAWFRENFSRIDDVTLVVDENFLDNNQTALSVIDMLGSADRTILITNSGVRDLSRSLERRLFLRVFPISMFSAISASKRLNSSALDFEAHS